MPLVRARQGARPIDEHLKVEKVGCVAELQYRRGVVFLTFRHFSVFVVPCLRSNGGVMGFWGLAIVVAFAIGSASCASTDGSVVARSEINRPEWVDGKVPPELDDVIFLVHRKNDISILDLGIKQAQAASVQAAPEMLRERVRTFVVAAASRALLKREFNEWASEQSRLLASLAVTAEALDAVPVRTYHEEIVREGASGKRVTFDVYVLLSVPRKAFDGQVHAIAKLLGVSKNPEFVKLGQKVLIEMQVSRKSRD